jgi:hypothetical protein
MKAAGREIVKSHLVGFDSVFKGRVLHFSVGSAQAFTTTALTSFLHLAAAALNHTTEWHANSTYSCSCISYIRMYSHLQDAIQARQFERRENTDNFQNNNCAESNQAQGTPGQCCFQCTLCVLIMLTSWFHSSLLCTCIIIVPQTEHFRESR